VRVNGKPATILGVMPEGFRFPQNQDIWMALAPTAEMESRSNRSLEMFGILKPGVPAAQAAAGLSAIAHRLGAQYPEADKGFDVVMQTFHERYNGGNIRMIFLLMLAAVGFVLLIACANVANMMLSRALGRMREISIRAAMGASRWQLIRQLLIESMMLSAFGGVLGLALAAGGVHAFDLATQDVGKPYWVQFTMDYAVFGYFAALCIVSGLLFGLAPALKASRADVNSALKDGGRSSAGGRSGGALSSVLVVFQFALTLVLLTGAAVFVRAFIVNLSFNQGLPASQLLTARVSLPSVRYADAAARVRFFDQLLPRIGAIPGVTQVEMTSEFPGMGAPTRRVEIEHSALQDPAHGPSAPYLVQTPGYFGAIGLPVLAGRDFNSSDGEPGHRSAVVSKEFAARYWPKQEAIGKRFRFYRDDKPGEWLSVTGVAADLAQRRDEHGPETLVFLPYRQEGFDSMGLMVRSNGNPAALTSAVRGAVQSLDQDLPLSEVRTLAEALEKNQWYLRLFGKLFGGFALIALVMASVGIYAVIAQAASSRTREIGVRMALGATSRNILGLVLRRGVAQLAAGLALGLAAAYPVARLMAALPMGVSPSDPVSFAVVSLVLIGVGLFACWLPARRAAVLDPVKAIRYE
jgi:predicted permease